MIFSRGIHESAWRGLDRLREVCAPDDLSLLNEYWDILVGLLRYDPHFQPLIAVHSSFRVVVCGLLRVFFIVGPLEDRYVDIRGVGRNIDWVP